MKPVGFKSRMPEIPTHIKQRMQRQQQYPSVDSGHIGAVHTKTIMDPKLWQSESAETVAAIKHKAMCIAPAYSKGAYQYVSAGTDPTDLGRKK